MHEDPLKGPDSDGRWYTVAETAEHFRVGKNAVYANCRSRTWPHHRVGTHARAAIRFSPEDWRLIDELLKVPPVQPIVPAGPTMAQIKRGLRRLPPSQRAQFQASWQR